MIELKDITKKYGKKVIFQNFNLKVKEGEMIAIIGSSGSGKSTLLNIIGLIESFNSGEYTCMGYKNVKPNSSLAQKIIRNDISYLFQNFALIEDQSVLSNLLLALKYVHQKKEEKVKKLAKAKKKKRGRKQNIRKQRKWYFPVYRWKNICKGWEIPMLFIGEKGCSAGLIYSMQVHAGAVEIKLNKK